MKLVNNKLQVRHYPQMPCTPFIVDVKDEIEAKKIMDTLVNQHLFLYENKIIQDYSNSIHIVMYDNEENDFIDYWNNDEGMDWDSFEDTFLSND